MEKAPFLLPFKDYFHPRGRVSRLQYLVFSLVSTVIFVVAIYLPVQSEPAAALFETYSAGAYGVYALAYLFWLYLVYCLNAKRLHDFSWPGALWLLVLADVPFSMGSEFAAYFTTVPDLIRQMTGFIETVCRVVTMILGLWVLLKRGDRGPNKYGPDPLQPPQADTSVF
jgi:uncharacterized membrane protein YhaH (DUF805 family)